MVNPPSHKVYPPYLKEPEFAGPLETVQVFERQQEDDKFDFKVGAINS